MTVYSFADSYKMAGLAPGPDIIRLRQEAFEGLRKGLDAKRAMELTRLYFGLPSKDPLAWFRDAFAETDPSFSMLENEQEASVLAECLLAAGLKDGVIGAGLAVLSAAASGNRSPIIKRSNLISEARNALMSLSVAERCRKPIGIEKITSPATKVGGSFSTMLTQQPNFDKAGELFDQISKAAQVDTEALSDQVRTVFDATSKHLEYLEEEVSMLWLHVSGWSRLLDCPFSELKPALIAGIAGIDLASLTMTAPGPVAVPAILHRLLSTDQKGKLLQVSIQEMVDALPSKYHACLNLSPALKDIADLCPALTGFRLAAETGYSSEWKATFRNVVGFDADANFLPAELAMQVYREALLLTLLDG